MLFLYWYPKLRKYFFYSECHLDEATHLFIQGTCKSQILVTNYINSRILITNIVTHCEIVVILDRNEDIVSFLEEKDRKVYENNPFIVRAY